MHGHTFQWLSTLFSYFFFFLLLFFYIHTHSASLWCMYVRARLLQRCVYALCCFILFIFSKVVHVFETTVMIVLHASPIDYDIFRHTCSVGRINMCSCKVGRLAATTRSHIKSLPMYLSIYFRRRKRKRLTDFAESITTL